MASAAAQAQGNARRGRAYAPGARGSARRAPGGAAARVRWDRLGRRALLVVLGALVYLYVSAGVHMLSTWRQSRRDDATVAALEREHRQLTSQHETLGTQGTLETEARRLGMMRRGEQPYLVSGLPDN
jgi:hypothetical protein